MYDIIGDVHGYLSELERLLETMGYQNVEGVWQHGTRKAVFVGDFVNRGPNTRGVIALIRKMVEGGKGYAILGNHELNAICYFTRNSNGNPIRKPSQSAADELDAILEEYSSNGFVNNQALERDIKWLRRLPFFLDFKELRIAHAYWSDASVALLSHAHEEGKLKKRFLRKINDKHTVEYKAVAQLTRGIEFVMPHDVSIKCNKDIKRTSFRVKWWEPLEGKTFRESHLGNKFFLPQLTMPKEFFDPHSPYYQEPFTLYPADAPFLFVGHYCLGGGANQFLAPNICCVDSCVASEGGLSAYRFTMGDKGLFEDRMVTIVR